MSMTSWLSIWTRLQRLPISFAKQTFNACHVLLAYFIISAVRILVVISGAWTRAYSASVGAASDL
jgi:hypothetical protein